MESQTKVFVKIDNYKDIIDIIELIKEKINEASSTIARLTELSSQEDSELNLWRTTIDNIQNRIEQIDEVLLQEHLE